MEDHPRYHDVVPYQRPRSLDALRGPGGGVIVLPRHVYWGPEASADLDTRSGLHKAYRNLIREGTPEVQEALLNLGLLRRV